MPVSGTQESERDSSATGTALLDRQMRGAIQVVCGLVCGRCRERMCAQSELTWPILCLSQVCVQVTEEFLAFSKEVGNDLSTPMPMYLFPGLQPGDRWCLCAQRWTQVKCMNAVLCLDLDARQDDMCFLACACANTRPWQPGVRPKCTYGRRT